MSIIGVEEKTDLLRELIYGESGTKKSWWSGAAAEYGFNVLVLNADKPARIYNQLTAGAQARLRVVNVTGDYNFADLIARLLKGNQNTYWDTHAGTRVSKPENVTHGYLALDPWKLTRDWVCVVDSWTALATAAIHRVAEDKDRDLSEIDKIEPDHYGPTGLFLDWAIERLKHLPCHLIVIGHPDVWEKRKIGKDGKWGKEIEFVKTQIVSSSRPHAKKMARNFTDVFRFKLIGNQFYVDSSSSSEYDGGSTTVPPNNYKWELMQFSDICKAAGILPPSGDISDAGCRYIPPGAAIETIPIETVVGKPVLQSQPTTKPAGNLLNLLKKGG